MMVTSNIQKKKKGKEMKRRTGNKQDHNEAVKTKGEKPHKNQTCHTF